MKKGFVEFVFETHFHIELPLYLVCVCDLLQCKNSKECNCADCLAPRYKKDKPFWNLDTWS